MTIKLDVLFQIYMAIANFKLPLGDQMKFRDASSVKILGVISMFKVSWKKYTSLIGIKWDVT